MTLESLNRPTGDLRWRTADQTHLAMPRSTQTDEEAERELATRAVLRLGGDNELLDILGLLPPTEEPAPRTDKRCSTCKAWKPRTEFYQRPTACDGLYSQCKTCHNRNAHRNDKKPSKPRRRLRVAVCAACEELTGHYARGWCRACWLRWDRAGKPNSGPPPVKHEGRREQYWELTRVRRLTPKEAAALMGMSDRNARRYETHFKAHGAPATSWVAA